MGNQADKQIKEIQEAQEALRESIAEAKDLADKTQRLLETRPTPNLTPATTV